MSNSELVVYTKLSPNHSGQRTHSIDRITPHCVVGQLSCEAICGCFTSPDRKASCNYGIGTDGRISLCVEEKNRSWCSSSGANDQRAVTIECASDKVHPYAMTNAVYAALIDLCTDICKRNGKSKLLWFGDKNKTLAYEPKADEMVLTVHRWFANKGCPGDWLYNRLGDLASKVTSRLGGSSSNYPQYSSVNSIYRSLGVAAQRNRPTLQGTTVSKRCVKGGYYPAERLYVADGNGQKWIKHWGKELYSALTDTDGSRLFEFVGNCQKGEARENVNFRESPSLSGRKIKLLKKGTPLYLTGKRQKSGGITWVECVVDERIGWCDQQWIK